MSQIRCIGALVNSLNFSHLLRNSSNSPLEVIIGSHYQLRMTSLWLIKTKKIGQFYLLINIGKTLADLIPTFTSSQKFLINRLQRIGLGFESVFAGDALLCCGTDQCGPKIKIFHSQPQPSRATWS